MRALITGITGFAGQYLAEHLVACGDEVLGSTFGATWSPDISPVVRESIRVLEWDLRQNVPAAIRTALAEFPVDGIFHLAAISVPGECGGAEPSPLATSVNVGGTRAVLELAQGLDPSPRVLVVSSSHVYAPVSSEHPYVAEDAPLAPRGAYGITKFLCEQLCAEAAAQGLDVIVARAFQHAGPRQLPKFMLPEWAEQFARTGLDPIRVLTFDSYNDLSDVRDVVRAYRLLLAQNQTHGVYNVGSGRNVRSGDVFALLARCAGRTPEVLEQNPGRRQHPIAEIARIATHTGWQPQIQLEDTVRDTWADFRSRRAG